MEKVMSRIKQFTFIAIILTSFAADSAPKLFPGYLGDKISPAWAVNAAKWFVSIDDRSSDQLFAPTLHIKCYVEKKKPDFCFLPDYDPNPGHAACMDIVLPGLNLWFSFDAHPNDPKPLYSYSFAGLFRLFLFPTFINRPVKVSARSDISFSGRFVRSAVSVLVNEDYQVVLERPYGRQWLYEFAISPQKQLNISGKGIKINAVFWHQDLEKWTLETLKKCP